MDFIPNEILQVIFDHVAIGTMGGLARGIIRQTSTRWHEACPRTHAHPHTFRMTHQEMPTQTQLAWWLEQGKLIPAVKKCAFACWFLYYEYDHVKITALGLASRDWDNFYLFAGIFGTVASIKSIPPTHTETFYRSSSSAIGALSWANIPILNLLRAPVHMKYLAIDEPKAALWVAYHNRDEDDLSCLLDRGLYNSAVAIMNMYQMTPVIIEKLLYAPVFVAKKGAECSRSQSAKGVVVCYNVAADDPRWVILANAGWKITDISYR